MAENILTRVQRLFASKTVCLTNDQHKENTEELVVRKNVSGKCYLAFCDDLPGKIMAVNCLKQSVKVEVNVNIERFTELMRSEGASDEAIAAYLASVTIIDEISMDDMI